MASSSSFFLLLLLAQCVQIEGTFHQFHPATTQTRKRTTFVKHPIHHTSSSSSLSSSSSQKLSTTSIQNANLITFDLDDTIFPVGPVVHDANKALIQHLKDDCGYESITEQSLIKSTKKIRTELKAENKVITYTELRQRAICNEINNFHNNEKMTYTNDVVVHAYNLWEENRHLAAERHLYHDTIAMLKSLQEKYPNAVIGAITNGKGNPLKMTNTIHSYFDFCISGEDGDVFPNRKPNKGIYEKSLERFYELISKDKDLLDDKSRNIENLNWIHIGDDLANDVGASSQCGAYAIWVDLNDDEYNQSATKRFDIGKKESSAAKNDNMNKKEGGQEEAQAQQPFWSTATKEEIEKRKKLNEESMQYVSARIETLSSLPSAIESLLTKKEEERKVVN